MDIDILVNGSLLVFGFLFIVAELLIGVDSMFDLVLSGVSLLIGGVAGLVTGSWLVGLVVTIVLLISYWGFGRAFVHDKLQANTVPSNSDKLIGKELKVLRTHTKDNQMGYATYEGEEWLVQSQSTIKVGDIVTVKEVQGVTLLVVHMS